MKQIIEMEIEEMFINGCVGLTTYRVINSDGEIIRYIVVSTSPKCREIASLKLKHLFGDMAKFLKLEIAYSR